MLYAFSAAGDGFKICINKLKGINMIKQSEVYHDIEIEHVCLYFSLILMEPPNQIHTNINLLFERLKIKSYFKLKIYYSIRGVYTEIL